MHMTAHAGREAWCHEPTYAGPDWDPSLLAEGVSAQTVMETLGQHHRGHAPGSRRGL
ncbi:hypothetical protein Shyhy01_17610 [Streptomyces hygroscopicus subsp. hygroscopicus]|nr:hypothetical protein Shyhy01_17610 [Streptomyces hygroscopicus subsp. hygroscopicus]